MLWLFRSRLPESGEEPRLHTDKLKDPVATLLMSKLLPFSRTIRVVTIDAKVGAEALARTAQYIALALLRSSGWSNQVRAVHRLVTNPNDRLMVGRTFEENGFTVRQNRLLVGWLPWFLVPGSLRKLIPRQICYGWLQKLIVAAIPPWLQLSLRPRETPSRIWCMEVYTLYIRSKSTGEVYLYGTFVEVAPFPRTLPARSCLGREGVWRAYGFYEAFLGYLYGPVPAQIAPQHREVYKRARRSGRRAALFAFPAFVLAAVLAKWQRGRGMACLGAM